MECSIIRSPSLEKKNIGYTILCKKITYSMNSINNVLPLIHESLQYLYSGKLYLDKIEFINKERIGTNYLIIFYRAYLKNNPLKKFYIRTIVFENSIKSIIIVVPKELSRILEPAPEKIVEPTLDLRPISSHNKKPVVGKLPPGQKYVQDFVIYKVFGIPTDTSSWRLIVSGLVKEEKVYTLHDIKSMETIEYEADFHCVTGWSVEKISWKGVPLINVIGEENILPNANWAYIESIDGYSVSIPLDDLLNRYSILVTEISNKELKKEQGFPTRIFIPHLYGWKSIKWINKIMITDKYIPGYWEALGYHPRGYIWFEERFFI